jgi:DNA polymerase-3 subunit delta'
MKMDDGRDAILPEAKGLPISNWGLLGHEWAVDMLKQHILHDSLRHAYLISGPAGVGRRTLALRLAQALNCLNPTTPTEPCRECRTCLQIQSMQHPDLALVQSEKEGGILVVEKVRAVRQSLVLKPFQAKYRVALFLRFQEANASAANALLKTLEEAPAHAILLLTTETGEQLLPTIVSRCEVIRLRPVPVERLEAALKERGAEAQAAKLVAHLSGGRPGAAFKMLADPTMLTFRNKRLDDLNMLLPASRVAKFEYAEKLTNRKKEVQERFRDTLLIWLSFWRDVLVCAMGSSSPLMNVDRSEEIETLAKRLGIPGARRLVNGIESAIERLEMNVNPRLLTEVTLLDWPH